MKKLFVSIPMKGRSVKEITASMEKMKRIAEVFEGEELELIDSFIEETPQADCVCEGLWYLGESIKLLATADVFIGIEESWDWKGCYIENEAAYKYGVKAYQVKAEFIIDNYRQLLEQNYKEYMASQQLEPKAC